MTDPTWLLEVRNFLTTKDKFFAEFAVAAGRQLSTQLRREIAGLIVRYREEAHMKRGGWKELWRERVKLPDQLEEVAAKLEGNVPAHELQLFGGRDMPAQMRAVAQGLRIKPVDEKGRPGNRKQDECNDLIGALAAALGWPRGIDWARFDNVLAVVYRELGPQKPNSVDRFTKRARKVLSPRQGH